MDQEENDDDGARDAGGGGARRKHRGKKRKSPSPYTASAPASVPASVPAPVSTSSNEVIDDVEMEVDDPSNGASDGARDGEAAEEADAPTAAPTAVLNAQAPPFVPSNALVSKTSNLKTEENRSKDFMTLKVGADGHTQPAAKGAGVMILVEDMTAAAYQMFVEGTRFTNMVVLAI